MYKNKSCHVHVSASASGDINQAKIVLLSWPIIEYWPGSLTLGDCLFSIIIEDDGPQSTLSDTVVSSAIMGKITTIVFDIKSALPITGITS